MKHMQFLIIGKDGTDEAAMERRLAVREAHLKLGDETEQSGDRWYGAALLDDNGKMIGWQKNRMSLAMSGRRLRLYDAT